ncbi:DUF3662 domain-containing protein [Phycicoccus sp. HDW14]|uniref:DUF3662 domain-containing protein n=1 Tax=Phycicoccus sp. HDW14 TaxID=2714941 RepID=UPI001F0FF058|nr:DUF3662 domain-containing protein [Phycicoccus sp. HDW14]
MGLLDRLEAGIERAVQGTFARHLRSAVHPVEIASNIRRAMDDRAVTSSGRAIVPNVFVIELSPGDFDRLQPDLRGVEDDLVAAAEEHCEGQHYQPAGPIDIVFEEHEDLETGVFRLRPSKASRPRATGHTGQQRAARPRPRPHPHRRPAPPRPPQRQPPRPPTTTRSTTTAPPARTASRPPRRPDRGASTPPTAPGSTSTASATP